MGINLTDDIRSITDLKRNTNRIIQQVHDTGRPVVLTVNGKAEAVLLDAQGYDKIMNALAMLKILNSSERDIKNGNIKDAGDFFREFRHDKKI